MKGVMARMRSSFVLCICVSLLAPSRSTAAAHSEYKNADGSKVVISSVGKLSGHQDDESKLEFYSAEGQRLCTVDYSSEDGEHGFGVVKAAWTPDNQSFVFSLTSSGGHQAWHAPTLFYSAKNKTILSLDSYVEASGISKAEFILKAPNTVLTEAWRDRAVPVSFHLDKLTTARLQSARTLQCANGKILRPGL
jgi:hypothetical protein